MTSNRTVYRIEISYPNKPGDWHLFYETFDTMTEASVRLIIVQDQFPKNVFRIMPVVHSERFTGGALHSNKETERGSV